MTALLYDIIGSLGAAIIVFAYFIMQRGIVAGNSFPYNGLNFIGASMIIFSLFLHFNLSVFIMESAVILISLYGMIQSLRQSKDR